MKKALFFLMTLMALSLSWGGAVKAQETHTVYEDETATSNNAPIRSGSGSQTEFVYPASLLANMEGGTITSVKFFLSSVYSNSYAGTTITVYMQEVEGTVESVSAWQYNQNTATKVYEGTTLSVTNSELVITFSTPYEYNGGNLCFNIWSSSTPPTNSFYGKSTDYVSCVYDYNITPPVSEPWSSGSASFLPKAEFTYTPAQQVDCAKPGTITLGTAGATQFPISWTIGGEEISWNVYLTQGGSPVEGYNPLVVNTTPSCTFNGLTAGTTYNVAIEAICGNEVSNQRTTSFTTEMCEATDQCQISVYRYDQYDDSWNGGSIAIMQNGNLVATVNCPTGSSETTVNYTVCKGVPVSFDFTRGNYPGEIGVTITDGGGGVVYESTNMSSVSAGTFLTIDNACPSCYKVLNLNHQDETTNGVTLTWDADPRNDASVTYTIYNVTDDVVYASEVSATSQPISGLNENTPYVFTVTTDCGSGDLSDAATVNFTTLASCPAPNPSIDGTPSAHSANMQWTGSANSYNVRYQVSNTIVEDFESGSLSNEWTLANSTSSNTQVNSDAAYNGSSYGFRFEYSEQNDASLISPVLNGTENGVSISFYYKEYSDYYGDEQFQVGYSSDENATDPDDFTYGDIVTASTSWQQYENTFPAGTKRIAIKYVYTGAWYLFIDDIDITIPNDNWTTENTTNTSYPISNLDPETRYLAQVQSVCGEDLSSWSEGVSFTTDVACHAPTSLAKVGDAEARKVALRWDENWANTNWQICLNGDEEHLINVTGADATIDNEWRVTYTLTGLTPDQDYSVKVRSNCGDEGFSQWSNSIDIHTAVACPAPTTLNNGTPGPNQVELTWVKTSEESAWQVSVVNEENETIVDVAEADVDGINTETNVVTYTLTGLTPSESYVVKVRANCGGEDGTSAWSNTANFNAAASCPAPVLAAEGITNITGHTADVAWTGFEQNNSYVVNYRKAEYINANDGGLIETFNSLTTAPTIPEGWSNSEGTTTNASNKWSYNASTSGNGATNGTSHDDSKCVRFNSYSNSKNYTNFLQTPAMDFPAGKTMKLSFWWKNPTGGDFSVYISTDGGTTKTPVAEGLTSQSTWTQATYELTDYIGASNVTIHFKGTSNYGSGNAYIYLDDVIVGYDVPAGEWQTVNVNETNTQLTGLTAKTTYEVNVVGNCNNDQVSDESETRTFTTDVACPAPTALTFVSATTNTATVMWTSPLNAWIVAYKAETDNSYTEESTTDNPFTIPNLAPANNYTVKVKADCSANNDGESEWSNEISFHTDCPDNFPLNYTCGFEGPNTTGSNVLPLCWTRIESQYYPAAIDNVNNAHEGTRYLVFSKTSNYPNSIAALPAIGADLNTVRISFYGKLSSSSTDGTINVGYVTDLEDATTFNTVQTVTLTTSYEKYTVSFGNVNPETSGYIALQSLYNTATATIYIDDITVEAIPSCVEPSELQFVSSTTTTATLQWIAGGSETAWDIYYSTENVAPTSSTTPLVSATTDNPATINDLTASSIYYVWVRAHCSDADQSPWVGGISFATKCDARTDFPITYGFETSEGFQTGVSSYSSAPTTNNLGNCWRNQATSSNGDNTSRLWCTATTHYDGSQSLMLPDKGSNGMYNTTLLAFPPMNFTSANGYHVSFWIYRNGSNANAEGFKVYASNTDTIDASAVLLGHYSRNYGQAYPKTESSSGWYNYDFYIPQDTITGTTYLIFEGQSYYGNSTYVDEITIEEAPSCYPVGTLTYDNVTPHSVDLSWDLVDNSQTTWYVQYATMPDFLDAEGYIVANTNEGFTLGLPSAETHYYVRVRANCGAHLGEWSNVIDINTGVACAAPTDLNLDSRTTNSLTISWTDNASAARWTVCYKAEGDEYFNCNQMVNVNPYTIEGLEDGTNYIVKVRANCGGIYNDESQWLESTGFFQTEASCPAPTNLTLTTGSETAHGATLTWTPGSTANEHYIVEYRISNENNWNTVQNSIDETTYTFTTLDPETSYLVRVSAVCGTYASDYSNEVEFTTLEACPAPAAVTTSNVTANAATISWNGTSDSYTVNYRTASSPTNTTIFSEGFETYADEAALEAVWTVIDLGDGANTNELGMTAVAKKTDENGFRFSSYSGSSSGSFDQYLISPELTSAGLLQFAYKSSSGTDDIFRVGYSTTTNDISEFTWGNVINSAFSWKTFSQTMPEDAKYFAINYTAIYKYRLYIDDIAIYEMQPAGVWQTVNTTETSTTLTSLIPETTYEAKVQGHCANDDSGESELISFTPSCSFYQLLTDASDLAAGDKIIIAAATYDKAMSTTQNTSNHYRGITDIIKNGNRLGTPSSTVQVLTLEEGTTTGTWALNTGNGYLKATSSSSNYLDTQDDITDNASWTITVGESIASIVANGTYTNNTMRYNNSSTRISCYSPTNSQYDLAIYKLTDYRGKGPDTTHTGVVATMGDAYECMGQTFTASGDYEVLVGTSTNGCDSIRILHLTLMEQVKTPTFSPAEGEYNLAQNVEISCETADATIHY